MKLNVRAVKVLMAKNDIDTQRGLADLIGISTNAVSEMLKGKSVPSLETIGALCKALNCTPNDILMADEPDVASVPKAFALAGAMA